MIYLYLNSYPILVEHPMYTEGPIMEPEPMQTSEAMIADECTIAPVSIIAEGSISADMWNTPPPFFQFPKPKPFCEMNLKLNLGMTKSIRSDEKQKKKI